MEMADRLAEDGFKDAGYEYVSIDVSFLYLHFNVYIHYIELLCDLSHFWIPVLMKQSCVNVLFRIAGPHIIVLLMVSSSQTLKDFHME